MHSQIIVSASYTGRTADRTIVTSDEIVTVPGVPDAVTFWHGPESWLYTCNLGDPKFDITTLAQEPAEPESARRSTVILTGYEGPTMNEW